MLAALAFLGVAGMGGGGAWLYQWYKHRPPPHYVQVRAHDIPVTPLEKELHPRPIAIHFMEAAAPLQLIGKEVPSGPGGITMSPAAQGAWKWTSPADLCFFPAEDWPAATRYHITIDRKAIDRHVLLAKYEYDVSTPDFSAGIRKLEFYQDPKDAGMKKVVCTLDFTHSVAPGEIEKSLSLGMLGKTEVFAPGVPHFTVDLGLHNRIAYIHTSRLELPQQEDFMKLILGRGLHTSQGGAGLIAEVTNTVKIPNRVSFFKFTGAEDTVVRKSNGDFDQFIILKTSAQAASADVAKGLEVYLLPHPGKKVARPDGDDASNPSPSDSDEDADDDSDSNSTDEAQAGSGKPEWSSPSEIDSAVLAAATPIPFTLVPSKDETSREHTFRVQVTKLGCLYVRVKKGTHATGGFDLSDDYNAVVPVPAPPVEIAIEGKGGLLALGGERKLSIISRGVEQIEYTISRVPADEINHLVSQTQGTFQNPEFLNDSFDENDIARISREKQAIASPDRFKANYSTFDFSSHLGPANDSGAALQGLFFLQVKAVDPKTKKYIREVGERRFILVTDLGILVKQNGDDSRDVFVQALASHAAMAGASVDILSRNGVPAMQGITGTDGRVTFPPIGKVTREKQPVAIVVRAGQDVSFIPYDRDDRNVNFSRFDTSGISVTAGADLNAFVFTERGVYRPGDDIHIGYSVKQADWGGALAGLPLETEIVDARNAKAQVKRINLPQGGFGEFTYHTTYESPTGDYTINIYAIKDGKRGDLLGSATALVKEFLPDRMKIEAHLSKDGSKGWITPEQVSAEVTLRNLYGTPATQRRITGKMELCPSGFSFDAFPGYTFFDRLNDKKKDLATQTDDLGEQTSDDDGKVSFDLDLERYADATYELSFDTEGFEAEGGRSVATSLSTLVSALPYVVGYKSDGSLGYVRMNHGQFVDFVAVDQGINRIAVQDMKLTLIQETYISVLTRQEDGTYAYESVEKDQAVSTDTVAIPAAGWKWTLPSANPGSYRVELANADGDEVSKFRFTVVGAGEPKFALDRNAELKVKLSKPSYNSGDDIEVSIVAPYAGSGLITIERDKVYASQWFSTDKPSTVQHIRLPEGLDGTGYVNVSFIRSLASREVFMSPLSYGVVPFQANRDRRHLNINLDVAKTSKPGDPLNITYKSDKPSKIVIFAVDEGILQVTNYKTPDPLDYFFQKQSLSVTTSQIVDLLLPEFSVLRAASTGGDGDAAKQLNPFRRVTEKPVVYWSGIVDADATPRTVTYNVPDFFSGNLKVMAVAISPEAVASADTESLIRGPFVLTPGVPTFVAPGDQFEVGVTVANNVTGSGPDAMVSVSASSAGELEVVKAPSAAGIKIAEGREQTVVFTLRARSKLGSAALDFHATAVGQESHLRSTLSIRPPVPFMTDVVGGNFTSGSVDVPVTRTFLPEYRHLQAVLSPLPLGLAHGLDTYLHNYPNGCSEQISSGGFCRLLLSDETDFGLKRADIAAQLANTYQVLRRRQNDQGGFGYWGPDKSQDIDFLSVYVMDFLINAKEAGFDPPADMLQLGERNLQRMVGETPSTMEDARTVAYAIYLLTREEVITTNYILNLRDFLGRTYGETWKSDLTAVYLAGAYAMLQKQDLADELIGGYKLGVFDHRHWFDFYVPLGMDAQYLTVIARHFPERLDKLTALQFRHITDPIGRGEFNTLSAAYAVQALKAYSHHFQLNPPKLSIAEQMKDGWHALAPQGQLLARTQFDAGSTALRFGVDPRIAGPGAYYQTISSGFEAAMPSQEISDGIEIYREYQVKGIPVTKPVPMGAAIDVIIHARSINGRNISNVAIVDLLPGGFEVTRTSLQPGVRSAGCDYVDMREDRNLFFTTVTQRGTDITYQIKATSRGDFTVPPVFAESMYDRGIKARGLGGTLRVVEAK